MDQLTETLAVITPYLGLATQIVGVFAIIARFTPTPIDNKIAVIMKEVINLLAMNSGPAENVEIPGDANSVAERKKRAERKRQKTKPPRS